MGRNKGGRQMIAGLVRYANGRINYNAQQKAGTKSDNDACAPSPKIKNERDLFNARCFKGGGQAVQSHDAIGQLWLVGKLDIKGFDETRLLTAARTWWNGRSITFADSDYKVGKSEWSARSTGKGTKMSRLERDFERYDALLRDADFEDVKTFIDMMQPTLEGTPQDWVMRIVQTEALRFFRFPIALLACDRDYAKLEAAKRALLAMAGAEAIVHSERAA